MLSSTLARVAARSSSRHHGATTTTIIRGMAMKPREYIEEFPSNFSMDAIKPPPPGLGPELEPDDEPM
jgi:hypothetical protein